MIIQFWPNPDHPLEKELHMGARYISGSDTQLFSPVIIGNVESQIALRDALLAQYPVELGHTADEFVCEMQRLLAARAAQHEHYDPSISGAIASAFFEIAARWGIPV